jgi:hypothetical protein
VKNNNNLSIYDLFRNFWDWSFENPDLITPSHCAVFSFAIEHCNRLGWKEKFGFPSQMVMEAVGIKSWHTYAKCFNDLVEWGFFIVHQKATNQYSANVIAIAKIDKAPAKALDKALQKHGQKHSQKQRQYNNTTIQLYNSTNIQAPDKPAHTQTKFIKPTIEEIEQYAAEKNLTVDANRFFDFYESKGWLVGKSPMKDWRAALRNWAKNNTGEKTGLNYLSGQSESELIAKINAITDPFQLDVALSKFQYNDQFTVLYHTELQKFISWDTMVKCPKIGKVARKIFTAKSIDNLLTPATYGQRVR